MASVILFEWTFEPAELFEEPTDFACGGYTYAIDSGKAEVRLSVDSEPTNWGELSAEVHQRLDGLFMAAQVVDHVPYSLKQPSITLLRKDGSRGAVMIAGTATMRLTTGRTDIQATDASGRIVRDTKGERIQLRKKLAQIAAIHIGNPIVSSILRSYAAAVADPRNELIHLYEVREALAGHVSRRGAAWRRLGQLANDEPLAQGRHRGKHLRAIRPATDEELAEARAIVRMMIDDYLMLLKP